MPRTSAKRHHNLPARRVRLIGRDQDLRVARELLLGTEGRLLTLIGVGGCGKTRLALELASVVHPQFGNGVALVELAAIVDPALVPQATASALGIRERPDESLIATLVRALSTSDLLLVLDNCEHMIEVCAQVAEQLLDHCPQLRVLATSREPLRIPGEKTWRVPSLALPDQHAGTDAVMRSPAVELFVERARAAVSDLALPPSTLSAVGRICTRLDGMPLAIELAAARVRALSVEQIHERLDDSIGLLAGGHSSVAPASFARHAGLELPITRRLGGRCVPPPGRVRRELQPGGHRGHLRGWRRHGGRGARPGNASADKSLVVVEQRDGQARYRLLEPVRQYAHERLVASGERADVRRRHAQHYQTFAEARADDANIGGCWRRDFSTILRQRWVMTIWHVDAAGRWKVWAGRRGG